MPGLFNKSNKVKLIEEKPIELKKKKLKKLVQNGDLVSIQNFVESHDNIMLTVNMTYGDSERTLLHYAAAALKTDIVRYLLKQGASPIIKSKYGYTGETAAHGTILNFNVDSEAATEILNLLLAKINNVFLLKELQSYSNDCGNSAAFDLISKKLKAHDIPFTPFTPFAPVVPFAKQEVNSNSNDNSNNAIQELQRGFLQLSLKFDKLQTENEALKKEVAQLKEKINPEVKNTNPFIP